MIEAPDTHWEPYHIGDLADEHDLVAILEGMEDGLADEATPDIERFVAFAITQKGGPPTSNCGSFRGRFSDTNNE